MNIASNKVKINPSSSDELSTQILPEDTPLIFQWLPKSLGLSVPNNEKYPYMQRLVNWAEREPQRKIYLVVNGEGLKEGQIEKLREDLKPASNIQVVDYQQVSKEVGFEHLKISRGPDEEPYKLSEILALMYNKQGIISYLRFANILDAMRLEIMRNIEKITSSENAIYFDFDIRPKGDQQIGPVSIPGGILLPSNTSKKICELENSIIGVNSESQNVIKNMYQYVEKALYYHPGYRWALSNDSNNDVYIAMINAIDSSCPTASTYFDVPKEWYDKFRFEKNCGNVVVESDKTWRQGKDIYSGEELPLHFKDQTITASDLPHLPAPLNHVATESTAAIDCCVAVSKETIESLPSKELPEDSYSVDGDYYSPYEVCYPNE